VNPKKAPAKPAKDKPKDKPKDSTKAPVTNKNETKKTEPKKADAKPSPPKPDPAEEAAKARKQALIEKAKKSIANIGQTRDKQSSSKPSEVSLSDLPGKIGALQTEAILSDMPSDLTQQERSYSDEIASRLKLKLRLPKFGEVKIKLTLERSGQFVKISVVSAASGENRKYVEKEVPKLSFPAFGNNFSGESEYTFTIVLSNEL
jgi:outer membrane biosynthesis protein TonB